jgi:hypothetical protein
MIAAFVRYASRRCRAAPTLAGLLAASITACASPSGGPAELIGTWRLLRANVPVPEACSTATLTFRRDGTFEGSSGALKTTGRYATTGGKSNYRLRLDQLEYSGTENCQGVTARDMQASTANVLDLAFEREGRDFRLSAPLPSDAYIVYTRSN